MIQKQVTFPLKMYPSNVEQKTNLLFHGRVCTGARGYVLDFLFGEVLWRRALAVQVSVEEDAASLLALALLDEFAVALVPPEGGPEGGLEVGLVRVAHHFADCDGCLLGVVEGDGGDQVVQDVGADDVVEEMGVDEAEVAIYSRCGTSCKCPLRVLVVWETCVRVLEIGDGDYIPTSVICPF